MQLLVGIYGKARAGKDTTGKYLEDQYGFTRTAFANYPKRILMEIFGLSHDQMFGDELKEVIDPRFNKTPRWILQFFLNDCCKQIEENVWVRKCMEGADAVRYERPVVVTDVRYKIEAQAIIDRGGQLWMIERQGAKASGGIANHSSELDLEDWDNWALVLDNNGSFEDLYRQVDKYMSRYIW